MHFSFATSPLQVSGVRSGRERVMCSAESPKKEKQTLLTSKVAVLPLLVRTARFTWDKFWRIMMSELAPSDTEGRYLRPSSPLKEPPEPLLEGASYAVYVGIACQWCHRVLLARTLLKSDLEIRFVEAGEDGLWKLPNGGLLRDVYLRLNPGYVGRYTAPLLVEMEQDKIVSNESSDILRLLGEAAGQIRLDPETSVWLRPPINNSAGIDVEDMEALCERLYGSVNDGVYRCGFATSQKAYEEAQEHLFACLDDVEARLEKSRFLCSPEVITEADVRLFPTVFRFDAIYGILFKASRKTIRADYPNISFWIRGKVLNRIKTAIVLRV